MENDGVSEGARMIAGRMGGVRTSVGAAKHGDCTVHATGTISALILLPRPMLLILLPTRSQPTHL